MGSSWTGFQNLTHKLVPLSSNRTTKCMGRNYCFGASRRGVPFRLVFAQKYHTHMCASSGTSYFQYVLPQQQQQHFNCLLLLWRRKGREEVVRRKKLFVRWHCSLVIVVRIAHILCDARIKSPLFATLIDKNGKQLCIIIRLTNDQRPRGNETSKNNGTVQGVRTFQNTALKEDLEESVLVVY